ncbi:MAG: PmoA family protein [Planctomycetota bacterium]
MTNGLTAFSRRTAIGLLSILLLGLQTEMILADHTVTITAGQENEGPSPVTVPLPADLAGKSVRVMDKTTGEPVVSQADELDGKPAITWMLPACKGGESRVYTLAEGTPAAVPANQGVELKKTDAGLDILIDGELFTTYTIGNFKPYCWPMIGPTGKPITRAYPMKFGVKGESPDHHHHRSFWFTHGSVNGTDFWSETPAAGKTVHREFNKTTSGPVFGELVTTVDWIDRKGKKVCDDVRRMRVYRFPQGRLFDYDIVVKAADEPVVFGDTKEGMFGFRVAGSMNVQQMVKGREKGHLINSAGDKDKEAWGKRAAWCDYYGLLEGETVGIAMFDKPTNFRHPTYWHARDYGLFCANPFGIGDFTGDKKNDGTHTLPANEKLRFEYRIYMHKGDADAAKVAEFYTPYANPPKVVVE